jgi:hypothetical protein
LERALEGRLVRDVAPNDAVDGAGTAVVVRTNPWGFVQLLMRGVLVSLLRTGCGFFGGRDRKSSSLSKRGNDEDVEELRCEGEDPSVFACRGEKAFRFLVILSTRVLLWGIRQILEETRLAIDPKFRQGSQNAMFDIVPKVKKRAPRKELS